MQISFMFFLLLVQKKERMKSTTAGLDFFFVILSDYPFASRQKEHKRYSKKIYALSFACAKESAKEKHTGNDLRQGKK